ncbi:MAG: urea ABC transporter ATP-binding protein UrtD [Nitrospira sp.]|nr:urea ABC transporter ATP-binding protein UrtD [Candidatus Manganitrophaceae bacterium]HIL35097.1 urea ABC transporter ATP-binding protein UrtD [Candidatus Manganitrophaceae bacterium]
MNETILYVEGVTVSFEGFKALRNLSFMMEEGELRVVIGPNGAGKTTLLDVICGKVRPTSGRVIFEQDTDLLPLREEDIANLGIGRKFQAPSVYTSLSVIENIELSLNRKKGVFNSLFGRITPSQRGKISATLETVGLFRKKDVIAGSLSHGEKQWLEIGMVIIQEPRVMLVDEPVAGMTDHETEKTGVLLENIAKERSVLVIEHDMAFVRQIARKVTVLHEGSVLFEGTVDEVQNHPKVREVYLGRG